MSEFRYQAFISYSHRDSRWARWVMKRLESYKVPQRLQTEQFAPKTLGPVFLDREEMGTSNDLSARITEALADSASLIVICSPAAVASEYVAQEITRYRELGRENRIFCLIVDGDPGDPDNPCFPDALLVPRDGQPPKEPLAADVRPGGDPHHIAFLKIAAGILGVGLDHLRQRDLARRQRRLMMITAASVIGMVLTGALAIYAFNAEQRAIARQAQAENLLQFMVGDLRQSLEPIGRLELLDKVGVQAMEYFSSVPPEELSVSELAQQTEVISQVGQIRLNQHQFDKADAAFQEALRRSEQWVRETPGNGDAIFQRAQVEFWLGLIHYQQGDLSTTDTWWTRYLQSAQALIEIDPARNDWQREVAYGFHNLGALALEDRRLGAADRLFRDELIIMDRLAQQTGDPSFRYDRADTLSWLGRIAYSLGNIEDAIDRYSTSIDAVETLISEFPENREYQFRSLSSQMSRQHYRAAHTGPIAARDEITVIIKQLGDLVTHDPTNSFWRSAYLNARLTALQIAITAGDASGDESRALIEEFEAMSSRSASVAVTTALASVMDLMVRSPDGGKEKLDQTRQALVAVFADLDETAAERTVFKGSLALVYLGDLYDRLGERDSAESCWRIAHDKLAPRTEGSFSPYLLEPWARVLARLGHDVRADRTRDRLADIGFTPMMAWRD